MTDDHSCRFGKWYFSEGKTRYGDRSAFANIAEPHRQIHATAKRVVELYNAGDKKAAEEMLTNMDEPTAAVLENLDALRTGGASQS